MKNGIVKVPYNGATIIYDPKEKKGFVLTGNQVTRALDEIIGDHINEKMGTGWINEQKNGDELAAQYPTEQQRVVRMYADEYLEGSELTGDDVRKASITQYCHIPGIGDLHSLPLGGTAGSLPVDTLIRYLEEDPDKYRDDFSPTGHDYSRLLKALKNYQREPPETDNLNIQDMTEQAIRGDFLPKKKNDDEKGTTGFSR